jgi:uncharacterized protein (TIGR02145 family)
MKKLLFVIIILCALKVNAQNYLISFAGTGESSTVSTVKVENLTAGTSLILNGGDILSLTLPTGINSVENKQSPELKIYPNPMTDNSLMQISPPAAGNATITIFDMTGKKVAQIQSYLDNYLQKFQISSIKTGVYLISVKGNTWQYSGKLLSKGKANGTITIEKISNNQAADVKTEKMDYKGVLATVDMAYTTGDRLKFTGKSGIYSTVMTDIPSSNKTITFNFIVCKDGSENNYSVVEIGTQVWMAENLKTIKYSDNSPIPKGIDAVSWAGLTSPAYIWYNDDSATFKSTYGALYNGYAVNSISTGGKNVCPVGWHVPTEAEWTTLITYLGGETVAGSKLKETGTLHWTIPNSTGTNETGFTGLPGGILSPFGTFYYIGSWCIWWSSTNYDPDPSIAYIHYLKDDNGLLYGFYASKKAGYSVRCLKN